MTDVVLPIVVIAVLVVVNGVFVAAEFAIVGARRSRLVVLADQGSRRARWLVAVFDRATGKDGYIAVAQLGITLASIGLGMYGEPAVAGWLYAPFEEWGLSDDAAHTVGFVVALSGITYLHVVLGEMIPKALALQAPERVSLRVNPLMRSFGFVFRPMVVVLNRTALGLMRLLRIPEPDQRTTLYTSAELAIVTDEAAESGQLGEMQRDLIRNVFQLDRRTAEELMTPRSHLEVVDVAEPSSDVVDRILTSSTSRYPVVDGSLDRVVGLLHIKDVIRAHRTGTTDVRGLARPIPTVAATADAEQVLERFRRDRTHAALVVDEFGGTLGLVTLDDIVAEVMDDEVRGDHPPAVHHGDGSFTVDGEATLAELRDELGVDLAAADVAAGVATVAGVVLASAAALPDVGERVSVAGWTLAVEAIDGHRIARVRVTPDDAPVPGRAGVDPT